MKKSIEDKNEKIKTLIVENHEATAVGTKQILEENFPNLKPIAIAKNDEEARKLIKDKPELIVMDIKLGTRQRPSDNGLLLANEFAKSYDDSKVLFYSSYDNFHILNRVGDNVRGYVLKDSSLETFIEAIKQIRNGKPFFLDSFIEDLIEELTGLTEDERNNNRKHKLSAKENEWLSIRAKRYSKDSEIAAIMFLKEVTCRTHKTNVCGKWNLNDERLDKLCKWIDPFPKDETGEIFINILSYWSRLEELLQIKSDEKEKKQAKNTQGEEDSTKSKDADVIRYFIMRYFLEITHDKDKNYLNDLMDNFDKFEQILKPDLNNIKKATARLILKIKIEISNSFDKKEDIPCDPEKLLEMVKEKLSEIPGKHRDLSADDKNQIYENIEKIEGNILRLAYESRRPMPNPKELYEKTIKKLEEESEDSEQSNKFTDKDKKALHKFFSLIFSKEKNVLEDFTGALQELGKLYELIKNDHAAKTCCDLVQLIDKR